MRNRLLTILLAGLALAVGVAPASAAVTLPDLILDDKPRTDWFERDQESRQGPETTDQTSRTFKVGTDGALDLAGISGDVRVTGGSGSEIQIEATKRVHHRNAAEAKRLLADLRVEINHFNDRVEVRTIYPGRGSNRDRGLSISVDYTVTVPAGVTVSVRSISGDIVVSGVRGEVRAETISGDVSIDRAANLTLAKTVSGNVTARDVGGATTMVLSTVSGTVVGSGLKVRSLEAGSVSGNLNLAGTEIERVEARSVSGSIDFDAPLARSGRYQFTSHSGNIRIVMSGSTGFELDADTFSGSVRSEVPVTLRTVGGEDRNRRETSTRAIRGSFGDASALLSIRSHSGSVVIAKK